MQIANYSLRTGVQSIFLTDGIIWQHYKNTADISAGQNGLNFNEVKNFNIATIEDDMLAIDAAAYLVANLDAALYVKQPKVDESDNLKSRIADLERVIREHEHLFGERMLPQPTAPSRPEPPWCILNDNRSWSPARKKPKQLWLPDNQIKNVTSWAQLLSKVCEYTLTLKPELFADLPIYDRAGASKFLLSTDRPGHNCEELTIEGQKVYLNKTYSAPESVANAVHMLEKLGTGIAGKTAILLQNE